MNAPRAPFQLSNSMRDVLHSCDRKFEFSKFYQNQERGRGWQDLAAECGHALHAGMEDFFVHRLPEQAVWKMMLRYPWDLLSDSGKERSAEACLATLDSMMQQVELAHLEIAQIKCLDGETRAAIEVPFEIELMGFNLNDSTTDVWPVVFVGTIDAIFWDTQLQQYVVFDIKTTTRKGDLSIIYTHANQTPGYGIVIEHLVKEKVLGFEVRYFVGRIDLENPVVNILSFVKHESDIQDWLRGLLVDLNRIKMFHNMNWWPRRGGEACMSWNRPCRFFDICASRDARVIQHMLCGPGEVARVDEYAKPWVRVSMEIES